MISRLECISKKLSQLALPLSVSSSTSTCQNANIHVSSKKKISWKENLRPPASEVLTCHLSHGKFPPWTSYFVKYEDIIDDQWGKAHFNWTVQEGQNYHILRTGCYPYIKYHCTKRPHENLIVEDTFFRVIKVLNLGLPCLAYGIAAKYLIKHTEVVPTSKGHVIIYFLYEEDKGSMY